MILVERSSLIVVPCIMRFFSLFALMFFIGDSDCCLSNDGLGLLWRVVCLESMCMDWPVLWG